MLVEPDHSRVLEQVRREALRVGPLFAEEPAHVGIDEALGQGTLGRTEPPGRMRIVLLIAELVVPAVLRYPADGRHLKRQTGRHGHGVLEPSLGLVGPMGEVAVEARRDAESGDNVDHRAQDHVVPTEAPTPKDRDGGGGHHGSDDEEPQQGDLAVPFPFSARSGLGPRRGCSVTGSLLIVEADNALSSCQSSMPLAACAESSKVDYTPLHHASNCNQYRADTDQYVCNFACLYSRSPRVGTQAEFRNQTLSL